jgi:hypothetical protein
MNCAAHVEGQLIPAGELVMVPLPVPPTLTESVGRNGANVTATVVAPPGVNVQLAVPEQGDPQLARIDPVAGEAVSVTDVPPGN